MRYRKYMSVKWQHEPLLEQQPQSIERCPKCREFDCRYPEFTSVQFGFWEHLVTEFIVCSECGFRSFVAEKVEPDVQSY